MTTAVEEARRGQRGVEVRIGVGPLLRGLPLRVLGYAACVAEAIRRDTAAVVRRPDRIAIFSSATKAGHNNGEAALLSLAALGGALRLAGVDLPISLELARGEREVPGSLPVTLSPALQLWLEQAAKHSGNGCDPLQYAVEHSAPSMFCDLTDEDTPPLRVTIGGATEAKFWAVRTRVRGAAAARGLAVGPAMGVILKSIRVPWYMPLSLEPPLAEILHSSALAVADLEVAANPDRGGNLGLKRELRATRRLAGDLGATELALNLASPQSASRLVIDGGFEVGERLALVMEGLR